MKLISELPNDGIKVLLLRRTGDDTVAASIGYRNAAGVIKGWYKARPPTHFDVAPPYERIGKFGK